MRNYLELYSSSSVSPPIEIPLPTFLATPLITVFNALTALIDSFFSTEVSLFTEPPVNLVIFIPSWLSFLWGISSPMILVFASEIIVDWLKHAFITKFNGIRPVVYKRFRDVLCKDLVKGLIVPPPSPPICAPVPQPQGNGSDRAETSTSNYATCRSSLSKQSSGGPSPIATPRSPNRFHTFSNSFLVQPPVSSIPRFHYVDYIPYVSKRIGFAALPLAALTIRLLIQIVPLLITTITESTVSNFPFSRFVENSFSNVMKNETVVKNVNVHALWQNETWVVYLSKEFGFDSKPESLIWWTECEFAVYNALHALNTLISEWGWTVIISLFTYLCLLGFKVLLGYAFLTAACSRYQRVLDQDVTDQSTYTHMTGTENVAYTPTTPGTAGLGHHFNYFQKDSGGVNKAREPPSWVIKQVKPHGLPRLPKVESPLSPPQDQSQRQCHPQAEIAKQPSNLIKFSSLQNKCLSFQSAHPTESDSSELSTVSASHSGCPSFIAHSPPSFASSSGLASTSSPNASGDDIEPTLAITTEGECLKHEMQREQENRASGMNRQRERDLDLLNTLGGINRFSLVKGRIP